MQIGSHRNVDGLTSADCATLFRSPPWQRQEPPTNTATLMRCAQRLRGPHGTYVKIDALVIGNVELPRPPSKSTEYGRVDLKHVNPFQ